MCPGAIFLLSSGILEDSIKMEGKREKSVEAIHESPVLLN
jgi:hypothetical protein